MTAPLGGHEQIYRGLLHLYPADFRAAYSDQMVQLFSDQLGDEGPTRSWLKAAGDIPGSAASEHLRRNRKVAHSMTLAPTPTSRILGLMGALGGAVLLAAFVVDIGQDINMGRIFLYLIGGMAVVIGVHLRQRSVSPVLALAGAVPVFVANAWLLVMEVLLIGRPAPAFGGDFGWVFFWASLATWMSTAWFGVVTLRLAVVSRFSAILLVIGSSMAILGIDRLGLVSQTDPTIFNTLALLGIGLQGLAWIRLGLEVALRRRPAPIGS